MQVKVINQSTNELPQYATEGAAGLDLRANLNAPIILHAGQTELIPTGLFIELPMGYEAQVRPRSGLAAKHGVTVLNSPGTIDADYRGEIKVILINHSKVNFTIEHGERIAQMVVAKHERIEWLPSFSLESSNRGEGGFGHTGKG